MNQFEVRLHGRDATGARVTRTFRTPALNSWDAMYRSRCRAIAAGIRCPVVFAVMTLPAEEAR